MATTTTEPKRKTITLTFNEEDEILYETICTDAKVDRRTPSQFLLMYLDKTYVQKSDEE